MNIKPLLSFLLCSLSLVSFADLDKAIEYAESGDKDKAHIELLQIAELAQTGDPKALFEFGVMYKTEGLWIVQSDEYAFENWLESAKLGYAPAQFSVGASYIIGSGVEKDLSEAKKWLQLAIDNTNQEYSKYASVLYNLNELDKY
jgi:TPR repeat protein